MAFKNSLIVIMAVLSAVAHSQKTDIISIKGDYKVLYPTKSNSLEVSVVHWETSQPVELERDGIYRLESERKPGYKISFQVANKKIAGNIVIVNFRPGDSTVIVQEDSRFQSSKRFLNKKLRDELTYRGDSVFAYVSIFDKGRYEGLTRLTRAGYHNIENKEFDAGLLLKAHTYIKDGMYYTDTYQYNILTRRKFIKDGQNTVLLFTDDRPTTKFIYKPLGDKYIIEVYDETGKRVGQQPVEKSDYDAEFPPTSSGSGSRN